MTVQVTAEPGPEGKSLEMALPEPRGEVTDGGWKCSWPYQQRLEPC